MRYARAVPEASTRVQFGLTSDHRRVATAQLQIDIAAGHWLWHCGRAGTGAARRQLAGFVRTPATAAGGHLSLCAGRHYKRPRHRSNGHAGNARQRADLRGGMVGTVPA